MKLRLPWLIGGVFGRNLLLEPFTELDVKDPFSQLFIEFGVDKVLLFFDDAMWVLVPGLVLLVVAPTLRRSLGGN